MNDKSFSGDAMRQLIRRAKTCTLSTLRPPDGMPYGALANIATDVMGLPIVLISRLAWHTQNLLGDPRASVLVAELPETGDPLVGQRVTVLGRFEQADDADIRRRYLAQHPQAAMYADFPDFSFWRMTPASLHGVAGFGRIETLQPNDVFPPASGMAALEASAIAHMNGDHLDAVQLFATKLLQATPGDWRISAIDPDGANLASDGKSLRLNFAAPVLTAEALRKTFAALAAHARNS